MATVIALLRGVNVGGKVLKMDALRAILGDLGLRDVETYLQSGNAVFAAPRASAALAEKIAARLLARTELSVTVLLRTPAELEKVLKGNPFLKEKGVDPAALYVTFLAEAMGKGAAARLDEIKRGGDRYHCHGDVVYVHCPGGYGRTKLNNNAFEARLDVRATTRNWRTVNQLAAMARARI